MLGDAACALLSAVCFFFSLHKKCVLLLNARIPVYQLGTKVQKITVFSITVPRAAGP